MNPRRALSGELVLFFTLLPCVPLIAIVWIGLGYWFVNGMAYGAALGVADVSGFACRAHFGGVIALLALATSLGWRVVILRSRPLRILLEHLALACVAPVALTLLGIPAVPHPTLNRFLDQVCR